MSVEFESLGLVEIIRLQNRLSAELSRRFERSLALGFSDVVGSTAYFQRFGDEGGRRHQQRHLDLLQEVLQSGGEGRVVDTAGDGAFVCFPRVEAAVEAFVRLQRVLVADNKDVAREQQLATRAGIHWDTVLTDDVIVTGDAVNLCARVAGAAGAGEIRLTRAAFLELPPAHRARCRALGPVSLSGIVDPVEMLALEWRDASRFCTEVLIEERGERIRLPDQERVTFGRLALMNGVPANDVVLTHPDPGLVRQISRWHFELTRRPEGWVLRPLSAQMTEVDGVAVAKGSEVPIWGGTVVRLSRALTIRFLPADTGALEAEETRSLPIEP
jgi:class 3 adenylate cyclase